MLLEQIPLLKTFLALIVLVNPSSSLALFLDITKGGTREQVRKVATISAISVFITVAVFTIAGEAILRILGISLGSFRVAGGLLVLLIAIGMMNGSGNIAKPNVDSSDEVNGTVFKGTTMAVVPLTIPMVIGPGGISTVIIYSASGVGWGNKIALLVAGVLISLIIYGSFMGAGKVSRFLGETGLNVLNRVMGMLLAAVAVEIIIAGLRSLFPQLT
ncbi:MarC family protein [Faucicola mancuniensis]|uniref:MarC family protein n=1 Tax=Faucicola mancuniensis TaxID=1309795 RepID=UPI0028EC40AC|nr:MarC family protein [uncultured Moraxella sp.]